MALPADLTIIAPLLRPFTIPSDEPLDAVAKLVFPEALYNSYITCCVILELPQTDHESFVTRLETLPRGFTNSSVSLNYVNGILVCTSSHRRINTPNPRLINGLSDDTDYIEEARCFSPGAMISSETGGQVTAGIALTRKDELRFTVAYHAWESEPVDKAVEETGQEKNELAADGSEVVKETGIFGVEIQAGRSNEETKAKNLGFQEKQQNSETNSLMPEK